MKEEMLTNARNSGQTRLLRSFALHYADLIGPSIPELVIARSMVTRLIAGECTIADLILFRERMLHRPDRVLSLDKTEHAVFEAAYGLAAPSSWEAALAIHNVSFQLIDIRARSEDFNDQQNALNALCEDMRRFLLFESEDDPEKLLHPSLPVSDVEARELARKYLRFQERTEVQANHVLKLSEIGSFFNFAHFDLELCWAVRLDNTEPILLKSSRYLLVDAIDGKILGTVYGDDEG
ncbi:MAG: hypothetical protein HOC28_04535 [Bacteroidetes Order II. Incertae sedis bacterium]|mgnify:CR=1 FL=1|nr:hypothetical protein [Bacteroidetes Order II. bacterium]MBT5250208.1 hypothetical protein [Bacteroidetes Order II. bacterium]